MHADGKLTQEDMKTLNKYMVNRLTGILSAVHEGRRCNSKIAKEFAYLIELSIKWVHFTVEKWVNTL